MSETPETVWLQPLPTSHGYYVTGATDDMGVVPYVRQDTADERVRVARREVWDAAIFAIKDAYIYGPSSIASERKIAIEARTVILKALEAARNAAEGEG